MNSSLKVGYISSLYPIFFAMDCALSKAASSCGALWQSEFIQIGTFASYSFSKKYCDGYTSFIMPLAIAPVFISTTRFVFAIVLTVSVICSLYHVSVSSKK